MQPRSLCSNSCYIIMLQVFVSLNAALDHEAQAPRLTWTALLRYATSHASTSPSSSCSTSHTPDTGKASDPCACSYAAADLLLRRISCHSCRWRKGKERKGEERKREERRGEKRRGEEGILTNKLSSGWKCGWSSRVLLTERRRTHGQ